MEWNTFFLCFILKSSGGCDVRPISFVSNLAKLFEKLVQFRSEWFVENLERLPAFQFGFRRGRSCTCYLHMPEHSGVYYTVDVCRRSRFLL